VRLLQHPSESGPWARCRASPIEILSSMSGCTACSCTRRTVGAMMKSERKSDNPINTWLGGNCGVPSAWRKNDSTMTMRVNEVTDRTKAIPKDSAVRMRKSLTAEDPPLAKASSLLAADGFGKKLRGARAVHETLPESPWASLSRSS